MQLKSGRKAHLMFRYSGEGLDPSIVVYGFGNDILTKEDLDEIKRAYPEKAIELLHKTKYPDLFGGL